MRPTRLYARNYRTWPALDFDVPVGCTAILGANGAGKSSIISILDLALFGGRDLKRNLARGFAGDMEVGVEFEHEGSNYRIRRGYTPKGGGKGTVIFERYAAERVDPGAYEPEETDEWTVLTRETAKATDEAIVELLGLTRDTFRASAFLRQSDSAAFTEADPRVRKQLLADMLGLDLWDKLAERARRDAKVSESLAGAADATLEVLERQRAQSADAAAAGAGQEAEIVRIDAELDEIGSPEALQEVISEAEVLWQHVQVARTEAAGHERDAGRALAALAAAEAEQEKMVDWPSDVVEAHRRAAASRPMFEQAVRGAQERQQKIRDLQGLIRTEKAGAEAAEQALAAGAQAGEKLADAVTAAEKRLADTETESECPTCHQSVADEAKEQVVEQLAAQIADLNQQAKDNAERMLVLGAKRDQHATTIIGLLAQITELEAAGDGGHAQQRLDEATTSAEFLVRYEAAEAQRESLTERMVAIHVDVDVTGKQVQRSTEAVVRLEAELEARREPVKEARAALARRQQLERERQAAELAAAGARTASQIVEALDVDMQAERDKQAAERFNHSVSNLLAKAYGRDGIPAMIVEHAAVPMIESEANRILTEFGTSYQVELRTQRATAKGDLKDTLDIMVQTDTGEALYEDFSGGERTRLNLALRIGLARLLAHRRGADVQVLVIDEPEFLDDEGVGRLAAILLGLRDDFEHVLLISHVPALADSFDQTITVTKSDDGVSSVRAAA